MNRHELDKIIDEGEGFQVEFKRKVSSPEKIARALSAFANTRGGKILFGVDDDGSIVGVESEKTEIEFIAFAGEQMCEPPVIPDIEIVPVNGKDVIVAIISESDEKPHYFLADAATEENGGERVYIRVNDKTLIASKEVIHILRDERKDSKPLTIEIGENERRLFRHLETHERITVKQYSDLVNISDRRASRILVRLVRAGVIRIHTLEKTDFFTLASPRQ